MARSTTLSTGGAQPKTKGIDELKKMRIDTIVDLRGERHGLLEKERRYAESLGMRLVNVPGYGWASPSDKEMAQFFALLNETPKSKISIHCWLGGYISEMRAFYFKEHWHESMKRYVDDFPNGLARSPELAPYRQMTSTKTHDTPAPESPAQR